MSKQWHLTTGSTITYRNASGRLQHYHTQPQSWSTIMEIAEEAANSPVWTGIPAGQADFIERLAEAVVEELHDAGNRDPAGELRLRPEHDHLDGSLSGTEEADQASR